VQLSALISRKSVKVNHSNEIFIIIMNAKYINKYTAFNKCMFFKLEAQGTLDFMLTIYFIGFN